jgi:hypothetical protein
VQIERILKIHWKLSTAHHSDSVLFFIDTEKVETCSKSSVWQVHFFNSKITAAIGLPLFYSPVLQGYIHLLQGEQQDPGSKHVAPVHSDSAPKVPHTPNTCMKIITIDSFLSTNQNTVFHNYITT